MTTTLQNAAARYARAHRALIEGVQNHRIGPELRELLRERETAHSELLATACMTYPTDLHHTDERSYHAEGRPHAET